MNIERLKHLQEILLNVPKVRFDMKLWVSNCGTTACAVGWACQDPVFNKHGLTITNAAGTPKYGSYYGWGAVEHFFGIDKYTAEYLFEPSSYEGVKPGPREVVARIEEVLEQGEHYSSQGAPK